MAQLHATTVISSPGVRSMMTAFRSEHVDHAKSIGTSDEWDMRTYYGHVRTVVSDGRARVTVSAEDDTRLSYMKMTVADFVSRHLGSTEGMRWVGNGPAAGKPSFFRRITVLSAHDISPRMRRVRFAAHDLGPFVRGGLHVRLLLPPPGRVPVWPTLREDGLLDWPSGEDALTARYYTIRAINPAEGWFDIDFVLHQCSGLSGSSFARNARAGEIIGMLGPAGGDLPKSDKIILLGDETALPAICRILEELPHRTRAEALIEVDDEADMTPMPQRESVSVTWLCRRGQAAGTTDLLWNALNKVQPGDGPQDTFIWAGCEFGTFRKIRNLVRKDWGLPSDRQLIVAYWRRGAAT